MSASLVGSEMCIRDRPACAPPSSMGRRSSSTGAQLSHASGSFASFPSRSVSYTHLTLPTICSV
eukprot:4681528-Alexandrium_andersonii.AAC.1